MVGYYTKTDNGTVLNINYTSLAFIVKNSFQTETDSSLNGYTTSAQSHTDFYSKIKN